MNDRLDDFGDEVDGVEVEDTVVYPTVNPAPEPAPVEPVVDPVPEPAPVEPAPVEPVVDPVPEPQPVVSDEEFDERTLEVMALHLRKREKFTISLEEAKEKILTDPQTKSQYKYLKELGKF